MIRASEAVVGKTYKSLTNFLVEIVEINSADVVVKSIETGHLISVDLDYRLVDVDEKITVSVEEGKMDETVSPATNMRKVKKSTLVDEGLKAGLADADIIKKVLESFAEATEKSIRNLISVRRSKMKKEGGEASA